MLLGLSTEQVLRNFQCPIEKGGNLMSSKHHEDCCCENYSYGYGYGASYGAGYGCGSGFNRWIYALLILIVIVLQFGRNNRKEKFVDACGDGVLEKDGFFDNNGQVIDNSVLFIIIVFLLIICAGCWGGGAIGLGAGGGFGN